MTAAAGAAPAIASGHSRQVRRRALVGWALLLPILVVHGIVVLGPAIGSIYLSMTDWSGVGPATFVGLDNFRRLFLEDPTFIRALTNNLLWMGFFLTVPFVMALGAASLLATVRRGALAMRLAYFVPYILPAVVVAQIWRYLLGPNHGIGAQLAAMGIGGLDKAFLGDPKTVLFAIAFVDNWHWWGFLVVIFLAAMQGVPRDLYDAARIDGAGRWNEFRHVTLPGIRPTVVFMLLMSAIWSFLIFEYVWILTQGGPAGASEVLGTLVVKSAFRGFEAGYGAAIGLTMTAIAGVVITVFFVLRRRGWDF